MAAERQCESCKWEGAFHAAPVTTRFSLAGAFMGFMGGMLGMSGIGALIGIDKLASLGPIMIAPPLVGAWWLGSQYVQGWGCPKCGRFHETRGL